MSQMNDNNDVEMEVATKSSAAHKSSSMLSRSSSSSSDDTGKRKGKKRKVVQVVKKEGGKSSMVWKKFTKFKNSEGKWRASCNFCGKKYAADSNLNDTTSLRNHIPGASSLENIEEWKWKLTMLLRDNNEQEVAPRERKDRRDFEQLSALATRMGLHSRQYSKIVVFSKVPLPNYRSDLDDKRPQREVVLPSGLRSRVDSHLKAYLSEKSKNKGGFLDHAVSRSSTPGNGGLYEQEEPVRQSVVAERILNRKNLQLRNNQQDWQESAEGQKMIEFRRSLPAYKEKDALLNAISQNQVIVVSGETGCGKTTQLPQYILESEIEASRGAICSIICAQAQTNICYVSF